MSHVQAIYRHGVFEPLGPVDFPEEQRVQVSIEPFDDQTPRAWLTHILALQSAIIRRNGFLPSSTPDISADRTR